MSSSAETLAWLWVANSEGNRGIVAAQRFNRERRPEGMTEITGIALRARVGARSGPWPSSTPAVRQVREAWSHG